MSTTVTRPFAGCALARFLLPFALLLLGAGCASYEGTAKSADPARLMREGKWLMVPRFERVSQQKSQDCGAAALASVLKYWGRDATPASVEAGVGAPRNSRLRARDLVAYARREGLRSYVFFGTMDDVVYELRRGRPVIVGLGKAVSSEKALAHYQVVVGYEPKQERVLLLDPARGFQVDSLEGFSEEWKRSKGVTIVTFLPAPAPRISAN